MGLHYCGSLLFAIRKYIMKEMILRNHGECIGYWYRFKFYGNWKSEAHSFHCSSSPNHNCMRRVVICFLGMGAFFSNMQEKILIQCSSGYEADERSSFGIARWQGRSCNFGVLKSSRRKTWTLAFTPVQQTCSPASAASGLKGRARKWTQFSAEGRAWRRKRS